MDYVDHVTLGLDDLPPQQRQPFMDAVATVVLRELNAIEDLYAQALDALDLYSGSQTLTFLLDYLGQLLGQARLTGQSNESYRRSLRVRVLVRLSCGTLPDVPRVAESVAREFGDGRWDTYRVDAHIIVVAIGQLDPDPFVRELVTQLVLDTIGEVDWLILYSLPQSPFTFDTPSLGWSQGLWAETVFASF